MRTGVFIDTAGWVALIHRLDDYHPQAKQVYAGLGHVKRMTTDAVLIESCNMFSKVPLRSLAITLMEKVRETEDILNRRALKSCLDSISRH